VRPAIDSQQIPSPQRTIIAVAKVGLDEQTPRVERIETRAFRIGEPNNGGGRA
jgi:hypothetical protein